MKKYNNIVKILKALAHPHRLELYLKIASQSEELLQASGHSCLLAGICDGLNIGAPTVSHHLKELTNAGLITTEREGKFLKAKIVPNALGELQQILFNNSNTQHKGE
jgi:ArsR family transcriptional regulator